MNHSVCYTGSHSGFEKHSTTVSKELVYTWYGGSISSWLYPTYCGNLLFLQSFDCIEITSLQLENLCLVPFSWQDLQYHGDSPSSRASKMMRILMFVRILSLVRLLRVSRLV